MTTPYASDPCTGLNVVIDDDMWCTPVSLLMQACVGVDLGAARAVDLEGDLVVRFGIIWLPLDIQRSINKMDNLNRSKRVSVQRDNILRDANWVPDTIQGVRLPIVPPFAALGA